MGSGGDRPPTGGVLDITAAVWTAGFHWWRSGNKKRTRNVSEYMLLLALCLVLFVSQSNVSLRSRLADQLLNDLSQPDHHEVEVLLKIGSLAVEGRKTPHAEQNGLCSS